MGSCMFFPALLALGAVLSVADTSLNQFLDFIEKHKKNYESIETFNKRFEIFRDNMKYIEEMNILGKNITLGETQFSDLTEDEFKKLQMTNVFFSRTCNTYSYTESNIPASIDWRERNAVTPVKDQGQCGSCWSFSATGAMEGAWAIKSGELVSLSEQQLVDCSSGFEYGNHGCNGGLMDGAFQYAIKNGMCSEDSYTYQASNGQCQNCDRIVSISDCNDVPPNNQMALKEAVSIGPVSIAIEADTRTFQLYKGGVISSDACGTNLDHGVLIVGYGTENETPYWLVKNSWGTSWGENGFVKIERSDSENDAGVCGIAMQPSFPIV